MAAAHFILFVADQEKSTEFYSIVLGTEARLNVPGMTEFDLAEGAVLGLMPEVNANRLLSHRIQDSSGASLPARCELYLIVDNPKEVLQRAVLAGATLISPFEKRNWSHSAGYVSDLDGHILAVASLQ